MKLDVMWPLSNPAYSAMPAVTRASALMGRTPARWRTAAVAVSVMGISAAAAGAIPIAIYGLTPIVSALTHANLDLLAAAAGVGISVLMIRAQRAAVLLSRERPVHLTDAYNAMVVGNGIGDLVPPRALRCRLTESLSSVSAAYTAGVFMLQGTLEKPSCGAGKSSGVICCLHDCTRESFARTPLPRARLTVSITSAHTSRAARTRA